MLQGLNQSLLRIRPGLTQGLVILSVFNRGISSTFFSEIAFVVEAEPDVARSNNASFTIFLILAHVFAPGEPFVGPEAIHAIPSSEAPVVRPHHGYVGLLSPITAEG